MKRLLLTLFMLAATQQLCARKPVEPFCLPYTVEQSKYFVVLETPVGPRRFIFDTGCPITAISESLRDELALETIDSIKMGDYQGHRIPLAKVRLDSLCMGKALFRNHTAIVMPDSSLVFACFKADGIAGSDLLCDYVVRMPNADSTITFAGEMKQLGKFSKKYSTRMYLSGGCPVLAVVCENEGRRMKTYAYFDTGSGGFFDYSYRDSTRNIISGGYAADLRWTEGYTTNLGWTNRAAKARNFRGVIPGFTVAGMTVSQMPVANKGGSVHTLGCKLFDWGQVVMDFPRKRFWVLPNKDAGTVVAPPQPLYNFMAAVDAGRLVVGQVWDESLQELIAPGDAIITVDGVPWSGEPCDFLLDWRPPKVGTRCEVETAAGSRATITLKEL
ncbi:retropepsin-like aspartic protease [uncultured Alistipes sp.]|jgi:hypothetical protein|uniref:retropepsin-like aspartic protease n=1 Tax=uncultured Alistipes sp. TaxID=538949 RepID=UPI0025FCC1E7|nr:retropepsin-like aspartic protease [uncultured Alistipes sp.]